jgi:hypothetical protein
MAVPTKLCCYDTYLLTVKPVINFIRKSNKEQKIEDKDVGGNTEAKKKEVSKMSVEF